MQNAVQDYKMLLWNRHSIELEGTHRVRTNAVSLLSLTLTFDLLIQNRIIVGYPRVIPYTEFEHIGVMRFLSYDQDISVRGAPQTLSILVEQFYRATHGPM